MRPMSGARPMDAAFHAGFVVGMAFGVIFTILVQWMRV